jgi:hypothetical protein
MEIIKKGTSIALVVSRTWANLIGVRLFLSTTKHPNKEIRGDDDSHVIFANVLDATSPLGIWIELHTAEHEKDPTAERYSLFVPFSHVMTIVIAERFAPHIHEEDCKIGFTS